MLTFNILLFQGNQFFGRDHDDDGSIHMESISQRGGKENWDDIGLSNNPLNDRYFSQVLYWPLIGQNSQELSSHWLILLLQPDLDRVNEDRKSAEIEASGGKIGRSNSDRGQDKLDTEDIDMAQVSSPLSVSWVSDLNSAL